jgi:hypothetical protein
MGKASGLTFQIPWQSLYHGFGDASEREEAPRWAPVGLFFSVVDFA